MDTPTLRAIARACDAGRDLEGALRVVAGQQAAGSEATRALRAAADALAKGRPASVALAEVAAPARAEAALLDAPKGAGVWTATLRLLAERRERADLMRERWVGGLAWPPLLAGATLLFVAIRGRFGLMAWLLLLAVAAGTALVVGLPGWLRRADAATRWAWLPGAAALTTARRRHRYLAGLGAALGDGVDPARAESVARALGADEAVEDPAGDALPPPLQPELALSLRQTADPATRAKEATRHAAIELQRWEEAEARLRRVLRGALVGLGVLAALLALFGQAQRLAEIELPDGKILQPEAMEKAIDAER